MDQARRNGVRLAAAVGVAGAGFVGAYILGTATHAGSGNAGTTTRRAASIEVLPPESPKVARLPPAAAVPQLGSVVVTRVPRAPTQPPPPPAVQPPPPSTQPVRPPTAPTTTANVPPPPVTTIK